MSKLNRIFPYFFLLTAPLFSQVVAQSSDVQFDQKRGADDSNDMDALRRWLQDKRLVSVKEIGGDLSLSGEVRTEFQASNELKNGVQQRNVYLTKAGSSAATEFKPMYAWDIEVNVMLDYRTDRTWAAIKIEFDNDMGQRSGTVNKIRLEKGYLGGRLIPGDTFTWDAEIGRRYLFNVFDSKLEFASLFDGILLRFNKATSYLGDAYVNIGSFLIDDKTNHYGFVTEMGALRIANVGLNLKYSLIDWYRPGSESESGNTNMENQLANLRYRYLVSQLLASYQFYPEWIGKKLIKFYSAGLTNHLAINDPLHKAGIDGSPFGKQNWGWYTGVSIGLVKKKGDWALDANYQWLQAQAVPCFDVSGIGRGNAAGAGLYTGNNDGSGGPSSRATAVGNGNYKGFEIEALYAFTDNLTIQNNFKYSWTLDKSIGPNLTYKQFELEFIYAF